MGVLLVVVVVVVVVIVVPSESNAHTRFFVFSCFLKLFTGLAIIDISPFKFS